MSDLEATAWMDLASCAGSDAEAWFPEPGQSPALAKRVCGRCPVRAECLACALASGPVRGVWGGTTEAERRLIQRGAA